MSPGQARTRSRAKRGHRASTPKLLALWIVVAGCGDDAGSDASAVDAATRLDAAVPDAGTDAGVLTCGDERCPERTADTPACCTADGTGVVGHALEFTGRASGLCGTDIGSVVEGLSGLCLQLNQPGDLDLGCPDQAIPSQFAPAEVPPMAGCCTDEGYCGSMELVFPLGCIYATGRKGKPCGRRAGDDAGVVDAG